jgi:hypothetical protein
VTSTVTFLNIVTYMNKHYPFAVPKSKITTRVASLKAYNYELFFMLGYVFIVSNQRKNINIRIDSYFSGVYAV